MRPNLKRSGLITLALAAALSLPACSTRYASPAAPMTGAWARQSVGWGPKQQGMVDLSSLSLDPGATVMYEGDGSASPLYAVEFGAERSFWRVEEFEPARRIDLGKVQTLIDELHNTSLCIVSCEVDRRVAEKKERDSGDALTELAGEVMGGGNDRSWDTARVGNLASLLRERQDQDGEYAEAVRDHLREAHRHADEIERELRHLLAGENVVVLRWNTGDADEVGYAIVSGLRRIRLVLGRDYASEPAFPSIDERNRLGWSRSTGVVTAALQAREIVYVSRRDVGASVEDLLSGAVDQLARSLSDEGVIGVNSAIVGERQRLSGLVSRGRLSEPRRYAVQMNWARFLSGELPPAFGAESMGDDGRWVTFAVATTQLRTLKNAGRLD